MRQLLHLRATRSLCYVIILALVFAIAPMPLAKPASGQLMPQYSVGVVDFINESGVQGELLARLATDAVVVEMSKTERYDVSITRSQLKEYMDKLDLRPPLDKLGLIRLGEELSVDAMLRGVVKSVQLSGAGATRKASVTLVVEVLDQASGETVNGAVQTGSSSARVGYTADDDSLITEAINNAAFLCVKVMVDYIIPEATIQMNIGADQVMLNKGARDGIKPGMDMIVLRQNEIIGYVRITGVDPTDSYAKVTKSMRGIQPEDKARAIFQMPTVSPSLKSEPLPSSAPRGGGSGGGSLGKIGKFLLGAAIVLGFAMMFRGASGGPKSQPVGVDSPMTIRWDPTKYDHMDAVEELLVLRDGQPFKSIRDDTSLWKGWTSLLETIGGEPYYGYGGAAYTINYFTVTDPTSPPIEQQIIVNEEPFGTPHSYQVRFVIHEDPPGGEERYYYTALSNQIVATAIEPVKNSDILPPLTYDSGVGPTEVVVADLVSGVVRFEWNHKAGADVYQMSVKPAPGNVGPAWTSSLVYASGGPVVTLPTSQQNALASLLNNPAYDHQNMIWRVDARRQADTSKGWVTGEDNWMELFVGPPGP